MTPTSGPTSRPLPPQASAGTPVVGPPPVLDPIFGRHWPDAVRTGRPVVLAALGVGILGGSILPEHRNGLAMFLVLAGAGATVAGAAKHRRDRFTMTCLALAALCTLPVVLLAAEWIAVLCVLAGGAATIAGVTRGRRLVEFVVAGIAWPLSGLRGLPWLGRSLRGSVSVGRAPRVVATAAWSLLGVVVFGLLFVSADAVMADWVDALLPDLSIESFVLRCFIGVFVAGLTLAAAYLALNPPEVSAVPGATGRPTAHRFEWLVPVLLIDAVFALFVAAQATVLFGGHAYVQRTTGLTYADYVHQGFGQLTIATLLMFIVVWGASRRVWALPEDRRWMRLSLGLLCALTLVVVVSALHRMHLYQQAYGFTRERLLADVFEGWLGVVVVAVALAGIAPWRRWVPRFALVTGVIGLLGLAAANPDAWIARHNIDRYESTGKLDLGYLASLSADALPTVLSLPEPLRACALSLERGDLADDDPLEWNLGRQRARAAADDVHVIDAVGDCPPGLAVD